MQQYLLEGIELEDLHLRQEDSFQFPTFIPLGTHEAASALNLLWVGVDIKGLVTQRRRKPASPKKFLLQEDIGSYLNVPKETRLLAVLNGQDKLLESFWGMRRKAFFELLKERGFEVVTGPTYSITSEESGFPASHNIFMQRRHHRAIEEIQDAGLVAVPNLYWRNESDMERWVAWLSKQKDLYYVTFDFSRNKDATNFELELVGLMQILRLLNKPLHVMLVGVGSANGLKAIKCLSDLNCTASVVSSRPVRVAASGGNRLQIAASGKLGSSQYKELARGELVGKNIRVMEEYLINQASSTGAQTRRNCFGGESN